MMMNDAFIQERLRRKLLQLIREDIRQRELQRGTVYRTDKRGNEVEIPPGYSYDEGEDGFGIAVAPGARSQSDKTGRKHSVPKGKILRIGKNGKGVVVDPSEATTESDHGQIKKIPRLGKKKLPPSV